MSLYDYCFLKFEFILAKEKFVLECTSKVSVLNSFNVIIPTVQHPPKPEYRQLYLQRLQNGMVTILSQCWAMPWLWPMSSAYVWVELPLTLMLLNCHWIIGIKWSLLKMPLSNRACYSMWYRMRCFRVECDELLGLGLNDRLSKWNWFEILIGIIWILN